MEEKDWEGSPLSENEAGLLCYDDEEYQFGGPAPKLQFRYLSEIGELQLLGDEDDVVISLKDLYGEIAEGKYGCCWENYEVYRYLKGLGYILGRHGVPWTTKYAVNTTPSDEDESLCAAEFFQDRDSVTKLLSDMHICDARPVFDVYLPNSQFKKSSPGEPSFVTCFSG
uniref:F16B3.1 protein n=1 Tax=Arabidopsis thaliana TaxID=3702 RepID=Q9M8A1_ARATH|nr:hypothetical protein [Arabidopsis thaliana]